MKGGVYRMLTKEVIPAFELSTWHERKPSVNLYGWNEIKMYHKKELLQ